MNIRNKLSDSDFHGAVTVLNAPFELYQFDCSGIIQNSDAFELCTALLTMKFVKKTDDFYSFGQTSDLNSIPNNSKPKEVKQFMNVLKEIKRKIAAYLRVHFNNTISVSCSKYDNGDYLLCHDDRVDDRSVAFVYYLNYDWLNEWGGTFDVYSVDKNYDAENIVKNINPQFNTMLFFPVGKHTHHQVAENVSNFSRISINGWFHSDTLFQKTHDQLLHPPVSPIYLPLHIANARINRMMKCIKDKYNDVFFKKTIKKTFIEDECILLHEFFKPSMVKMLCNELFSNDLQWKVKGPLNKKCHKYLDLISLQMFTNVLFVVNMLKTDHMFNFFTKCTGLEFSGVNIEVQRWHGGHYMMPGGNNSVDHFNILSVYMFFNKSFRKITNDNREDMQYVFVDPRTGLSKFICAPQDNTTFIVFRDTNLECYVKYCKKVEGYAWTVIIANYFIKNHLNCKVLADKIAI